jgi:glyoxylase-like metal-dependent hydrolase (beta-lactamase superfamily II)
MIRIPTPFQVGDVNVYVLGDTLIDTGPKTAAAIDVLRQIDLKSIKNVLITHGHVDHHGLASYIREVSNCTVLVHKNDLLTVTDYKNELKKKSKLYKKFLEKAGMQKEIILTFGKYYELFEKYGENCDAEVLGDKFETENGLVKVIHTPGHTGGSCSFLCGDVLYAGDTLLPRISTNPSIHSIFDEQCGLEAYEKSLERISGLNIEKVLPGHGTVIKDYRGRIQEIMTEHLQRQKKIIASLSGSPQTLLEITEKVFGEIALSEMLLALAECHDHLGILKKKGICEQSEKNCYYSRLM